MHASRSVPGQPAHPTGQPATQLGRARLLAQGLVTRPFATPHAAVAAHGAMQGQDLAGVIASAALRTRAGDARGVIAAMDAGLLVRGYPMRGTVFLMAADDVLWVSQLCNAGPMRAQVARRGQIGLDGDHIERASELAAFALADEPRGLSRAALMQHWQAGGIPTDGGRGYHVLSHLIGRGEVVFGPWNGVDQNIVPWSWLRRTTPQGGSSLEERFNGDRLAAVAELLERYLTSHGPATVRDFAWWTKLPLREIRPALALITERLESSSEPEPHYWRPGLVDELAAHPAHAPLLLPGFDEFVLGYRDRLFAMADHEHALLVPGNNGVFKKTVVRDGRVVGIWTRAGRPGRRALEMAPFTGREVDGSGEYEALFAAFPFVTD